MIRATCRPLLTSSSLRACTNFFKTFSVESESLPTSFLQITTKSESDTETIGEFVAQSNLLGAGDLILLTGQVGNGKTVFARGLIRALAKHPALVVPSPSFLLAQEYELGTAELDVHHLDLYRLPTFSEIEWEALGLEQVLNQHITVVEWPEKLIPVLKTKNKSEWLQVNLQTCRYTENDKTACGTWSNPHHENIDTDRDVRVIRIVANGTKWHQLLKNLHCQIDSSLTSQDTTISSTFNNLLESSTEDWVLR